MSKFMPYQDDSSSMAIDGLTVESRVERVAVYGSVNITKDKQGLKLALALQSMINATVHALQSEELPEKVEAESPGRAANPFR